MLSFITQNRLYLILSVATVFGYLWLSQCKKRLRLKEWMAFVLAVCHTVVGVLCVKLFAFLESGSGGMSLYGAVFFLPIVYYAFAKIAKRDTADVFDVFTICTITTLLCARFNCILADCCLGAIIPGTDGMRWPTRTAEIVFYVVLYIFLRKKVGNKTYRGKIYPIYALAYGVFRFVVEFFRESEMTFGWFHISHLWSTVAVIASAAAIYAINKHYKRDNMKTNKKNGKQAEGRIVK